MPVTPDTKRKEELEQDKTIEGWVKDIDVAYLTSVDIVKIPLFYTHIYEMRLDRMPPSEYVANKLQRIYTGKGIGWSLISFHRVAGADSPECIVRLYAKD